MNGVGNLRIPAVVADSAKFHRYSLRPSFKKLVLFTLILASGEIRSRTVATTRCMMLSGIEGGAFSALFYTIHMFSEQFMMFNDISWGLKFYSP